MCFDSSVTESKEKTLKKLEYLAEITVFSLIARQFVPNKKSKSVWMFDFLELLYILQRSYYLRLMLLLQIIFC